MGQNPEWHKVDRGRSEETERLRMLSNKLLEFAIETQI